MFSEKDLEQQIIFHRNKYWVENNPIISDKEYDQLIESLKQVNPRHILLTEIEYNVSFGGEKIPHSKPLLSLEKVFTFNSIKSWMQKVARNTDEVFIVTPKYDGICCKYYASQNIIATRGNGIEGENITSKLPLLEFESDNVNNNRNIIGEIVIKYSEFEKCELRRKDGSKYKTARNIVSGIMNLKDVSSIVGKIKLTFVDHKKISTTFKYSEFDLEYWENVIQYITALKDTYPMDGIVIELQDELYGDSLGVTSHHPRSKIAFKFENQFAFGTIESISFSSGKRKLTPVANITPIVINGVTIKRVTLHNAKMIIDNDIHIGDELKVVRSGDVIPYVAGVTQGIHRTPIKLNECPYCKSKLEYREPELYCTNVNCNGTSSKLLFESVRALGIDGIGQTSIDKFVESLEINSVIDILTLEEDDIADLPDFGEISAANIVSNISKVINGVEDYKLLAALNIKSIGINLSKQILKTYTLTELMEVSHFELNEIQGIGHIRAVELQNEIANSASLLLELMEICNVTTTKNINSISLGAICFSGTFPNKKDYYKAIAENAGYTVSDSVTKNLSYLVTAGASTSKVTKARSYRIPILKVDDFLNLIQNK